MATNLIITLRNDPVSDVETDVGGIGTGGKTIGGSGGTEDELWLNLQERPYSQDADYDPCAESPDGYTTRIIVNHSPGLNYRLVTSYGSLGAKSQGSSTYSQSHDFNLNSNQGTGVLLGNDTTFEVEGDVLDSEGNPINPNDLEFEQSGSEIFTTIGGDPGGIDPETGEYTEPTGDPVVGTVRVTSTVINDEYVLTITARPASQQDSNDEQGDYTATVRAFWEGRVSTLTVYPPEGGTCERDYEFDPDDDDKNTGCYKLKIKVNKCTGKVEDEYIYGVPCPDEGS